MIVKGYKAFNKNKENKYGMKFNEGKSYSVEGIIQFGNNGNGYHMCTHLSDVFRFIDCNKEFYVAEVLGSGECLKYDDEYNGYYDMYAVERIEIVKFLTREDIIKLMLKTNEFDVQKFISTFKMNLNEITLFCEKYKNKRTILLMLMYYQLGQKNIYDIQTDYIELVKRINGV